MIRSGCHRFFLEGSATRAQLVALFERIAESCRNGANAALLVSEGAVSIPTEEMAAQVRSLACACASGFRLACVAPLVPTFESWVRVEDAGLRDGIVMRVFFDEANAQRWLGL